MGRSSLKMERDGPMKIALFLPNWIGDVVMATPVLRGLREHFPKAELLGIGRTYIAPVLEGNPWLDRWVCWDRNWFGPNGFFKNLVKLRREKVHHCLLLTNSFRTALYAKLGNCQERIGYSRYGRGFLLSKKKYSPQAADGSFIPTPIIDEYIRLLEPLGVPHPGYELKLYTTIEDEKRVESLWQTNGFEPDDAVIGFNPGGAFGQAKHWPRSSFVELAKILLNRYRSKILVLCGPGEREIARQIVRDCRDDRVFSLAEENLSIGLTKACVKRLRLLVTTDSGPRHFAAAFKRPVVSLFGPTHIPWTITYYSGEICLQKKVPCGPCQKRICPTDHRCMRELSATEVALHVDQLMQQSCSVQRSIAS